jgi:hypothetical protein
MRALRRLWPALEQIPGLAGVKATWREHLGDEAIAIAEFLRPTDRQAVRYPCPRPGAEGCPREVVDRNDGTFIAACGDRPLRCEALELRRADLTIHELDMRRLAASVAVLLGLDAIFQHVAACAQTWQVGAYVPVSGEHFPAYLTIQDSPDGVYAVAVRLAGIAARPFLLFVSTRMMIDSAISELLGRNKSRAIALADVFAVDERGQWAAQRPPAELFREFRVAVFGGEGSSAPPVRFQTPPGASWEEVTIRFITQHQIHVRVREASGVFEHIQMGMGNRRNDLPTRQWELLQLFADHRGELNWSDFGADPKNEHRRLLLGKQLRGFFGLDGDPFAKPPDGRGWRTRFTVIPED